MVSDVYFTDFRNSMGHSMLDKMISLIKKAGIDKIDFQDKFVAVKLTFGEWGNVAFVRHQFAKVLCDYIKSRGGMPFLTDCNTLYAGYRNQALSHLDAAYMNGFSPLSTGVHTIIADGLRGTDERDVPVKNGELCRTAKIGSAIMEADIVVSLTHFKGHIVAGYGGVLKNLGMGSGSKMGKMDMHSSGKPVVKEDRCIGCGMCVRNCAHDGVKVVEKKAVINEQNCVGCGHCFSFCPKGALDCSWKGASADVCKKIAEYAQAVIQDRPNFHVCFVKDVSPYCDCDKGNDSPVVPDIGVFAGFDPLAIDQACVDAVNSVPIIENSHIGEHANDEGEHDVAHLISPDSDWEAGFAHAEKIGVGTREYRLIEL